MLLEDIASQFGRRRFTLFTHLVIVLFFSFCYFFLLKPEDFNGGEGLKKYDDYLYYSIVTHASVGYGDISPKTRKARTIVSLHIIIAFVFIISLWI